MRSDVAGKRGRTLRRRVQLVGATALIVALPAATAMAQPREPDRTALNSVATATPSPSPSPSPSPLPSAPSERSSTEQAPSYLERENMELRIESKLKDASTTWFATLIAISIALFAILITVVVIFFAIRTKEAAVAEAAKGFEEFRLAAEASVKTVRTEAELAREKLEDMLTRATTHFREIGEIRQEAQIWAENIAQRIAAAYLLSATDQLTLDIRSKRAEEKTADQYSPEDFYLLIAKQTERKEWDLVRELAGVMRLQTGNRPLQSAGHYYEGLALYQLKRMDEALAVLTDAIGRFGGSGDARVETQVAKCRNNLLVVLMARGEHERALEIIPEALEALKALEPEKAKDSWRKLMINKGNALSRLDRHEEALATYDEVVRDLGEAVLHLDRDRLAHAHYNRGCEFALMGRAEEAVAALETSRSISVTPLTSDIDGDRDFDPIRGHPSFLAFLDRQGLRVAEKQDAPTSSSPVVGDPVGEGPIGGTERSGGA